MVTIENYARLRYATLRNSAKCVLGDFAVMKDTLGIREKAGVSTLSVGPTRLFIAS